MRFPALLTLTAALAGSHLLDPAPAEAQSDILLQLRSGSPQGDRFRVDSAGGFVALGQLGIGIIPATGMGERFMWYPFKGAFRAGSAGGSGTTAWDDSNIGFYSWAGGYQSRASAYASFAFGDQLVVSGVDAAAFGASNTVSGTVGFSAGNSNECSAFACVAIGHTNRAAGQGSIALGERVHASANWSVALGRRAHANHTGSFTWGDASTTDSLRSSANNRFHTRAAGGYRLFTNAAATIGVSLASSGSSWASLSDRNRKESFAGVDGEDALRRLRNVPVSTWTFIDADEPVRHIGPMAQDWHAAFGLKPDSLTIDRGDFDGVSLAAIQALEARTRDLPALEREMEALRQENAMKDARIASLETEAAESRRRLERLEALLGRDAAP
jgi:trimeric autotransporter adhesin